MDAVVVVMWLRVSVFSLFLVARTCAVPKDAYCEPQLGCGDTVIAQEGSNATLLVYFDVGDRPNNSYVLLVHKPSRLEPWIMCWSKTNHDNHDDACDKLSQILGRTYQLRKTIRHVGKKDSGNYRVSLTVTMDQKEIRKNCNIVLRVVEASPTTMGGPEIHSVRQSAMESASPTTMGGPEIHSVRQSAMESGSGKEENELNVKPMVIVAAVTTVVVSLVWLGVFCLYRRRMRRSLTNSHTSVETEMSNTTAASSHEEGLRPPLEEQNHPESTGLLHVHNNNSDGRLPTA